MRWLNTDEEKSRDGSFLASIFDHVIEAIVVIDSKGRVIGLNSSAELLTGYDLGEPVEILSLCSLCAGMLRMNEITCYDCFATKDRLSSFQMMVRVKDGSEFPVTASSSHFRENGEEYMVLVLRDAAEQIRHHQEELQRQLTHHVIRAQEEERKRVSRDLHDSVGQALYSVLVGLKVLSQVNLSEEVKRHLEDIQLQTARALDEVKHMAVELRPSALDDLGLVAAIRAYLKRFEETFGIETDFEQQGLKRRYDPNLETALYRILQEAMNNAAKYADADHIHVQFKDDGEKVELIIQDDGVGFDLENIEVRGSGLGLYGMKERASLFGGEVSIRTAPGEGTTINVKIELNDKLWKGVKE